MINLGPFERLFLKCWQIFPKFRSIFFQFLVDFQIHFAEISGNRDREGKLFIFVVLGAFQRLTYEFAPFERLLRYEERCLMART